MEIRRNERAVKERGVERVIGAGNEVARVRQAGLKHRRMEMKSADESTERITNQKGIENEKAIAIARRDVGKIIVAVAVEAAAGAVVEAAMMLPVAPTERRRRDQKMHRLLVRFAFLGHPRDDPLPRYRKVLVKSGLQVQSCS